MPRMFPKIVARTKGTNSNKQNRNRKSPKLLTCLRTKYWIFVKQRNRAVNCAEVRRERRKNLRGTSLSTERTRCEQELVTLNSPMTTGRWEPEAREIQSPSVDGQLSSSKTWRDQHPRDGNPYGFPAILEDGWRAVHGGGSRGCCRRCLVLMKRVREAQEASQTGQEPAEWLERVASPIRLAQVPADAVLVRIAG